MHHVRQFLVILALAVWFGGFTFYAGVVIPMGHAVLGSEREVGFITRQVTFWLNAIGVGALSILLWDVVAGWRVGSVSLRNRTLAVWGLMVIAEVGLFVLHPILDGMLDPSSRQVLAADRFYNWHRAYLIIATVQWLATLGFIWMTLHRWRRPHTV